LDKSPIHILKGLKNNRSQKACLSLYSQGYLAKTFIADSFKDRLKQGWNKFAYKISISKKKGKNWEGNDIVKHYQLPVFQTLGDKIVFQSKHSKLKSEIELIGSRIRYMKPAFIDEIAVSCDPDEA
jgi:hypothetical protein